MGLRILITNFELWSRSGTTLYTRDLALEFARQGHSPVVYTLTKGVISDELADAGIVVTDDLRQLDFQPEIIHGHHFTTTMAAVQHFAGVPAIFVCHDHTAAADKTPFHHRIYRYFGVSRVCVGRLLDDGVPADQAALLLNFVDLRRFRPRPPLPERAQRALVFSNYAAHIKVTSDAGRQAGLALDVVGQSSGNAVARPEEMLGQYDLVFAKGKAAIEAMAVGTAVILCDFSGVGPMVTSAEFDELQPLNFGFQALREPLQAKNILRQITRYNAQDAARVRDLLRASAGLEHAAKNLVELYQGVIDEHRDATRGQDAELGEPTLLRQRAGLRVYQAWASLKPGQRAFLIKLPGARRMLKQAKTLLIR